MSETYDFQEFKVLFDQGMNQEDLLRIAFGQGKDVIFCVNMLYHVCGVELLSARDKALKIKAELR